MSSKKITFSVPDWLYDGIKEFMAFRSSSNDYRIEDLFKACAINRLIQIGYLDEFGYPLPVPKIDFSKVDMPSWSSVLKDSDKSFNIGTMRSICSEERYEKDSLHNDI